MSLKLKPIDHSLISNRPSKTPSIQKYEEAANHILDALVLQDSDSGVLTNQGDDKRGVTSTALWDSLKTCCLHMQRIDLATICDKEDLDGMSMML